MQTQAEAGDAASSQGGRHLRKPEEATNRFSPGAWRASVTLTTPGSGSSSLHICDRINVRRFKPPGLWCCFGRSWALLEQARDGDRTAQHTSQGSRQGHGRPRGGRLKGRLGPGRAGASGDDSRTLGAPHVGKQRSDKTRHGFGEGDP